MKKHYKIFLTFILAIFLCTFKLHAQLYFPPKLGSNWDTTRPQSLFMCPQAIDSLYAMLDSNHTKGFIFLENGKIVLEKYFGTFTKDSLWYWASAGKTLAATLVGIAQQKSLLNIQDSTIKYLGNGFTIAPTAKEQAIRIFHHLTMTTGLDENVADQNCIQDTCLKYLADAGTRWYYYNAPYLLLHNVLEAAAGISLNALTNQWVKSNIGMNGLWFDGVYYSTVRDFARFGLLMLNKGIWNQDTILSDTAYYRQMTTTSTNLNESYGYLWWLNGKNTYKLPGTTFTFTGPIVPQAPQDMLMGLGKYDQKLYVIPSRNWVIVRLGNSSGSASAVPIVFDQLLWKYINNLFCVGNKNTYLNNEIKLFTDNINETFAFSKPVESYQIFNMAGQCLVNVQHAEGTQFHAGLSKGFYIIVCRTKSGNSQTFKWMK